MNKLSKIFWLLAGIFLIPFGGLRLILGYWWGAPYIFIGFIIPFILCVLAIVLDYKTYADFFAMKTTKHGLNTGTIIVLMLIFIVSLNVISVLNNTFWDLTEEKLYTLSDQSKKVLSELKDDLRLTIFYQGTQNMELGKAYKRELQLYVEASSKFKMRLVDAYVENALAHEYFGTLSREGGNSRAGNQITLFLDYKKNREKVRMLRMAQKSLEEKITNAIIKVTRSTEKVIYFLKGHGEKKTSAFKKALEDSSFVVKDFEYYGANSFPSRVDLLVIAGMKTPLYAQELESLKDYARRGGRFFIALDPGENHKMEEFLSFIGVQYKNKYIVNDILFYSSGEVLGHKYHPENEITRDFAQLKAPAVIFPFASEVTVATKTENIKNFSHESLIESDYRSYAVQQLTREEIAKKPKVYRHRTLALLVKGVLDQESSGLKKGEKESSKEKKGEELKNDLQADKSESKDSSSSHEYKAVVFGDSDFISSEKSFFRLHNKDIALNAVSHLLDEGDLVSIRPKKIEKTKMSVTTVKYNSIILGGSFLPSILLILGIVLWFRRQNA